MPIKIVATSPQPPFHRSSSASRVKVSVVDEAAADDLSMLHICRVEINSSRAWLIEMVILNQTVCFKLETGAECNVMGYGVYLSLVPRP